MGWGWGNQTLPDDVDKESHHRSQSGERNLTHLRAGALDRNKGLAGWERAAPEALWLHGPQPLSRHRPWSHSCPEPHGPHCPPF